ncbi:MAG: CDP-diacylglycerol--glycerol-3-phosphate 3-phosphatidyltransferase [bacterium]|nr:CDP-diacylglycerol--glycerol-3-phosphate 3-phosphatidyltransferase [bacterium]
MNLPNKLTLLRIILVPFFVVFLAYDNVYTWYLSLLVFVIAAITDIYDGKIARKYGIETTFGKFADPLADKILVASAFIYFVTIPALHIPAWMVILIIAREFVVTGLRLVAMSKGVVIPASLKGKLKTTFQITTIIIILLILLIKAYLRDILGVSDIPLSLTLALEYTPLILMSITTLFTVITGIWFTILHKKLLTQ